MRGLRHRPRLARPWYDLRICGPDGARVGGWLTAGIRHGLDALADADTVIVPSLGDATEPPQPELVDAVRAAHRAGARVASLCRGAFVLAEAVRLGEPATAVDLLLMPTAKNEYLPNGHNRQTDTLPIYLPGNGGLLTAVALMARGADSDAGRPTPGFPADGRWTVRHEGLRPLP